MNLNSAKFDLNENKILQEKESRNNEDNYLVSKYNSSNKKINKITKFALLENKTHQNGFFTERNDNKISKLKTYSDALKNTFFTSKERENPENVDGAYNNDKILIKPFNNENKNDFIDKEDDKGNNSRKNGIKNNIIKDITLPYYYKRKKKKIEILLILLKEIIIFQQFLKLKLFTKRKYQIMKQDHFQFPKKGITVILIVGIIKI